MAEYTHMHTQLIDKVLLLESEAAQSCPTLRSHGL